MSDFSYLDGWQWSVSACLLGIIALGAVAAVPATRALIAAWRNSFLRARSKKRLLPLLWIPIQIGFGLAFVAALGIAIAALLLAATHSIINFYLHASRLGIEETISRELAESMLPLRVSSVALLWATAVACYRYLRLSRGIARASSAPIGTPERRQDLNRFLIRQSDQEETLYGSDNQLRGELVSLPHAEPPTLVFFTHLLHLGFISLSVAFCWIFVAVDARSGMLAGLNWLTLFSAHDAGLVFGYYYLLKGRMLGWHWLRRLGLYSASVALMIAMSAERFSLAIDTSLVLVILAGLATLMLCGVLLLGFDSRRQARIFYEKERVAQPS